MTAARRAAIARAAGWTGVMLPGWVLVGWLLGLLSLAVASWGLVLGCELGLAWTQGAGYPPLGVWSWLSEARFTVLARRVGQAVAWMRSRVPWDGVGCIAVFAGPVAVIAVVTSADWAPRLAAIVMVGAAVGEVGGAVLRARRWRSTVHNAEQQDGDR